MSWQVNYALLNVRKARGVISAEHVHGEAIKITVYDKPDVLAVISNAYTITAELATQYHQEYPDMDFLCGYRKECVWEGGAIRYLEDNTIGWGSAGTLSSAISVGNANTAAHKEYVFSYRLIRQLRCITNVVREFDRVLNVSLSSGRTLRIGMILEYEPTADAVRTLWYRCGPVDIAWNINPSGNPTQNAIEAGRQLGCKVVKWEDLKTLLQSS
ncbi:hypothetical protein [Massilia aerilata]|uniref:Uncharacterized protein n=1 Tax=Massilia aerilata TaxID=453817 RepID=A0ABW0S472_9BURK